MKNRALIVVVCLIMSIFLFSACTENLNQKAIAGDYSNKEVTSNGGLAVTYGKYLYFINGQAEEDAGNIFGKVIKGAIMRVELGEDGPVLSSLTTIVPKKVYSIDAKYGGIYIYNDYIYYSTTGLKRDSKGDFKTSEKVVMRTKIDGTKTQVIAEFSSHDIPYKVVNNSMVYIKDSNIYRINLNDKKFKSKLIEESIGSTYHFTKSTENNKMDNYLIYTKLEEETSRELIKILSIDGSINKEIFSSNMIGEDAVYSAKIIDMRYFGEKLTVFYNIQDDNPNKTFAGIFAYTYDDTFTFDKEKLVRLTKNTSDAEGFGYSEFYYINDCILALGTAKNNASETVSKLDLYSLDGDYIFNVDTFNSTINIYNISIAEDSVYIYYTSKSKFYQLKILSINESLQFQKSENDAVLYYDGTFSSQGVSAEIIMDVLYFANGEISNNIYFLNLSKVKERDNKSRKPSPLGKITDEDRIAAFN